MNTDKLETSRRISRRGFGRAAGVTAAVAVLGACDTMRSVGESPGVSPSGSAERGTTSGRGDAFEMLTSDHRRIEQIFTRIEATPASAVNERERLLGELKTELTRHAVAEENVLYPAYMQNTSVGPGVTEEFYHEHASMKQRLFRLEQMPKNDPNWMSEAMALRREIAAHVREEEDRMFPQMRAAMSPQQIDQLTQMVSREMQMVG
ncbi:MAG TPA: hemerythrin domain-containing protein [Alphaproteobacteria bacterium]